MPILNPIHPKIVLCGCGQPLHYTDPANEAIMCRMVDKFGEFQTVTVAGRSWRVARHFIALHGVIGYQLPELAMRYGFEEIT